VQTFFPEKYSFKGESKIHNLTSAELVSDKNHINNKLAVIKRDPLLNKTKNMNSLLSTQLLKESMTEKKPMQYIKPPLENDPEKITLKVYIS